MSTDQNMNKSATSMLDGRSLLLSGSIWSFAGMVVAGFLALGVQSFLARVLPPAEVGLLAILQSIVSVVIVIANPGIVQYIPKLIGIYGSDNRIREQNSVIKTSFLLTVIFYLVAGFLIAFTGLGDALNQRVFPELDLGPLLIYAFPLIILTGLLQHLSFVYRGLHRIAESILFGIQNNSIGYQFLFLLMLVVGWKATDLDLALTLKIMVLSTFLPLVWAFAGIAKKLFQKPGGWYSPREILKHSYPIWGSTIGFIIISQSGIWIVGAYAGESEVALYASAIRLTAFVMFPLMVINAVIPPIIARMYHDGHTQELQKILRQGATVTGVGAILLGIIFIAFAEPILVFLFGPYYGDAKWMLIALTIGQVVNVAAGSGGIILNMTGFQRSLLLLTLVNIVALLVVGIGLAIPYGANGVAFAISATLIMQNILMVLVVRYRTGMWVYMSFAELPLLAPGRLAKFFRKIARTPRN